MSSHADSLSANLIHMSWKVGALPVWTVPKPLQRWGDKHQHREENWVELFFDIMFVPMAMALGQALAILTENFADDGKDLAAAILGCFLVFGAIHRTWITFTIYINKFDQKDLLSHGAYAGLMMTTAMMGAYSLPNKDRTKGPWWVLEHTEEFVYAFAANQIIVMFLYLYVAMHLTEFRGHFLFQAANQAYIAAMFFFSLLWAREVWMFVIWAIALVTHSSSGYLCHYPSVPVSIPHITTRCGCFVMVLLGESVIQILQANEERLDTWYKTSLALSLWTVFNLALQYFHTQPRDPGRHALSGTRRVGSIWFNIHTFLGFCVLMTGVGLEMVFKDAKNLMPMDISLLCCGVGASLLCLVWMRFLHKGHGGSVQRKCAYLYRIIIGVILLVLPAIIGHLWPISEGVQVLAIVSILTAMSTTLDYLRRTDTGGAHQPLTHDGPPDMLAASKLVNYDENMEVEVGMLETFTAHDPAKPRLCEM